MFEHKRYISLRYSYHNPQLQTTKNTECLYDEKCRICINVVEMVFCSQKIIFFLKNTNC